MGKAIALPLQGCRNIKGTAAFFSTVNERATEIMENRVRHADESEWPTSAQFTKTQVPFPFALRVARLSFINDNCVSLTDESQSLINNVKRRRID